MILAMNGIGDLIKIPFGYLLDWLYQFTTNYGLSLILFAIIIKLVLLPASIKSKKSSMKMSRISPRVQALQEKYAGDQQKQNEAIQALYKEEGVSMGGGCLWSFLPLLILFPLYAVVRQPITYMLHETAEVAAQVVALIKEAVPNAFGSNEFYHEMIAAPMIPQFAEELKGIVANPGTLEGLNFNFLGINLGDTPTMAFNALLLIPILSFASQMLMTVISFRNNNTGSDNPSMAGMKATMYMMPFLSAWICFSVPAGVGMYWIVSSVLSLLQMVILNKFYNPKEMAEKARIESERRRELEKAERARRREEAKAGEAEAKRKALSQKEINRQKLAEARRRDAEKYGEVYVEVTDKDLE